jgi:hypothetical protein
MKWCEGFSTALLAAAASAISRMTKWRMPDVSIATLRLARDQAKSEL